MAGIFDRVIGDVQRRGERQAKNAISDKLFSRNKQPVRLARNASRITWSEPNSARPAAAR